MKNLILIAIILIAFACKKKTVTPELTPEPVCEIAAAQFEGKYVSADNDTVVITFLHNNCPTNKSNTYLVKGIGKVANKMLKSGETFEVKDYEVVADEKTSKAVSGTYFSLSRESSGNLLFNSYKINNSNIGLQKI